jgi:hypothetical protein
MSAEVHSHSDGSITVSFTFSAGPSMLQSEQALQAASNEANNLASAELLQRFDTDGTPITMGKHRLTSKGRFGKNYQTPYGEVRVERHVYQSSQGGSTFCPLDNDARIVRTATPLLARQVAFKFGATNSTMAQRDFAEHGRHLARSFVQTVASDVASIIEEKNAHWNYAAEFELQPGSRVATIAVGMDGTCGLFCEQGYREVMVGTIALYDPQGERLHTTYLAEAPENGRATFLARLDAELSEFFRRYPDAQRVAIADGAHSLWPWLEERTLWQAVDFWHAAQYLAGAAAGMAKRRSEREKWREQACHRLKHETGAAASLLEEMSAARIQATGAAASALDKAISYFTNHGERMNYSLHLAMNFPIGSGVTEAACKTVVKQRMCGSGMKWRLPGAREVLALRTMILTEGRWEQFWSKISRFGFNRISGPSNP